VDWYTVSRDPAGSTTDSAADSYEPTAQSDPAPKTVKKLVATTGTSPWRQPWPDANEHGHTLSLRQDGQCFSALVKTVFLAQA
jgi:hypothetical protein